MIDCAPGEPERLEALDAYDILDTPAEEAFDRITRLARRMFDLPIATVTFVDAHRQWFKSGPGLAVAETAKAPALCRYTIAQDAPLVIADTHQDLRFRDNPLVTGGPMIRFYAGAQLRTPAGHVIGTVCVMDTRPRGFDAGQVAALVDLAQIVMDQLELRRQATTDALTGVLSRSGFRDEANRAITLALRHRHNLGAVMIDLDHFKRINDRHGHATGDAVLRETIAACRGVLRGTDIIGRLGGEEFAVLLQHTDRAGALQVAEKLRQAVDGLEIAGSDGPLAVTASFGVAALEDGIGDVDGLLRRADIALYQAKANGRNRCEAWREAVAPGVLRRVLKAGSIAFNNGGSTIDCTVRALSGQGASLDLISTGAVPDRFKLRIPSDNFSRICTITAKRERGLDVAFG